MRCTIRDPLIRGDCHKSRSPMGHMRTVITLGWSIATEHTDQRTAMKEGAGHTNHTRRKLGQGRLVDNVVLCSSASYQCKTKDQNGTKSQHRYLMLLSTVKEKKMMRKERRLAQNREMLWMNERLSRAAACISPLTKAAHARGAIKTAASCGRSATRRDLGAYAEMMTFPA